MFSSPILPPLFSLDQSSKNKFLSSRRLYRLHAKVSGQGLWDTFCLRINIFIGSVTFLWALMSVCWSSGWLVCLSVIISKRAGSYTSMFLSKHFFDISFTFMTLNRASCPTPSFFLKKSCSGYVLNKGENLIFLLHLNQNKIYSHFLRLLYSIPNFTPMLIFVYERKRVTKLNVANSWTPKTKK